MADNKTKQDGRDDAKIDTNDQSEVSYAAEQFGVTPARIRQAIEVVGNSRQKVKEFLKQ